MSSSVSSEARSPVFVTSSRSLASPISGAVDVQQIVVSGREIGGLAADVEHIRVAVRNLVERELERVVVGADGRATRRCREIEDLGISVIHAAREIEHLVVVFRTVRADGQIEDRIIVRALRVTRAKVEIERTLVAGVVVGREPDLGRFEHRVAAGRHGHRLRPRLFLVVRGDVDERLRAVGSGRLGFGTGLSFLEQRPVG